MKYLITGQSGFIGTSITNYLCDEVISIPRDASLKGFIEQHNPDVIIHLAAYGNHSFQTDANEILITNIFATLNLLEASKDIPYKKFYNISSSSVELKTKTFYSISKQTAEDIATLFAEKYNKPIVNIRPYSVYGPGEASHRFIPTVIRALQTGEEITLNETATHDWIFIDDFIAAMFQGYTSIGTGVKTTNLEVVRMLEEIARKKLNYKPGTLRSYDNEEWVCKNGVPHIELYEGLKRTYESFT